MTKLPIGDAFKIEDHELEVRSNLMERFGPIQKKAHIAIRELLFPLCDSATEADRRAAIIVDQLSGYGFLREENS